MHNFITWDDAEDNDFKVRSLKAAVVEVHFGQDLFVNGTRWLESTAVNGERNVSVLLLCAIRLI